MLGLLEGAPLSNKLGPADGETLGEELGWQVEPFSMMLYALKPSWKVIVAEAVQPMHMPWCSPGKLLPSPNANVSQSGWPSHFW